MIPKREIPESPQSRELVYIEIHRLVPSAFQSRLDVPSQELEELADSIKTKGVIQPLIVRKKDSEYEIVAGSRRYYAAKLLNIKELPVIIKELTDEEALVYSLIENLQRQELNPIEEAQGYWRLQEEFGFSQEKIAESVGKDRTTISNFLRLLKLPEEIQEALRQRKISYTAARAILSLEEERAQLEMFARLMSENLSVREVEQKVSRKRKRREDPFLQKLEEEVQKRLGRKVKIVSSGKKGKIIIEYYSLEDLETFIDWLKDERRSYSGDNQA